MREVCTETASAAVAPICRTAPTGSRSVSPSDSSSQWKYSSSTDERLPTAPYWSAKRQYGASPSEARRKEIVSGRLKSDRNPSPTHAAALHNADSSHSAHRTTRRMDLMEQTAEPASAISASTSGRFAGGHPSSEIGRAS